MPLRPGTTTSALRYGYARHAALVRGGIPRVGAIRLLDVAGGTGAFSITICRKFPALRATILDFPTVEPLASTDIADADLGDRVAFLPGNALAVEWPDGQDAVLQSYLLSAVGADSFPPLFARAHGALRPGGQLMVHDFFVDDDRQGPAGAALWFTTFLFNQEAVSFSPADITALAETAGFVDMTTRDVIPGLTRLLTARKSP